MKQVLSALRAHAASQPRSPALVDAHGVIDYAELQTRVDALAAWLASRCLRAVGLCGENSTAWVIADLAAAQAGICVVPLPPFFSSEQLDHVLRSAALSDLLVCSDSTAPRAARTVEPSPESQVRLHRLPAAAGSAAAIDPAACKVTFTSGTTGTPKGVLLTAPMIDAVVAALAGRIQPSDDAAHAIDRHFVLLPLATLLENLAGVYVPLALGRSLVVLPGAQTGLSGSSRLDLPQLLQALHQHQPGSLIVLPQILAGLVAARRRGLGLPASLRFIAVGGATTPLSLLVDAQALGIPVYQGYGLSECASVASLNAPAANRPGSVGKPLAHVAVRIVDGAVQIAGVRGPGYLGDPRPDVRTAAADWLDTGDLGHLDDDGYLYITGRSKNLLISSFGRNISPEWIEAELTLHPAIAQAMLLGDGEAFCAALVVPAAGHDAAAIAAAISDCNRRLPDYAQVRRFAVAERPFSTDNRLLTDNGRLRRAAIAARYTDLIARIYAVDPEPSEPGVLHAVL